MLPGFIVECVPDGGMEFAEALYVAHYQSMYRIARGIVRDASAAEDVVHDAFLEAVKRLELLREMRDGGRAAYLATIARSRAYNYLRREKLVQPEEADFLEEHGGVEDNACDQALLRLDYEQADSWWIGCPTGCGRCLCCTTPMRAATGRSRSSRGSHSRVCASTCTARGR